MKILLLSLLISPVSPAIAQTTDSKDKNNAFLDNVLAIAVAGFGAFSAYATVKLNEFKQKQNKKLEETEQQTRDKILEEELREPPHLGDNEKRNVMIIVGLGGSGKTTLIKRLSKDENVNPEIPTPGYMRYSWREKSNNSEPVYIYYAADHKGQNIGSLIKGLIEEQKIPYSPMTWGAINSLIFVIDITKAQDEEAQNEAEFREEVEKNWKARIDDNIKQWSPTALDTIFGFTTKPSTDPKINSLKYVCLFINKMDLLPDKEEEVKKLYQSLIQELRLRCSGLKFEVIIGSVKTGTGLPVLTESLKKYSWSKVL
ncbi:MAG: GTPase domain-containing protein [Desmonostoc geniculatum HA4340-LM1]|nr:GTPase domain-containing protein [Desmonostoc geniculatum HA4340-LM1]